MASTGNVFPGTGASANRGASGDHVAWTNPGNVVSDNTTDTTCALGSIGAHYLVCSNFDFSALPSNVEIRGITVRVEASETGTGNSNYIPQLISATTPTLIGSAKTAVTVNGTTPTVSTNGGTTDLWSAAASLNTALIKTSAFGVAIWSDDTTNTLSIDYVTIAVEWTDIPGAWNGTNYFRRRKATRHKLRTLSFDNFPPPAAPQITAPGWLVPSGFFKRKNLTHHRRARVQHAEQSPPPRSNDREFEPPFVTRYERSRRSRRAPDVPVTTVAPPAASPDRTLREIFVTAVLRSRKLLRLADAPVYPSSGAPAQPLEPAWRLARSIKRRVTRHVLRRLTPAPYTPRTPNNEPEQAWRLARSVRTRVVVKLRVLVHNVFPATPAQTAPEVSWRLPRKFYVEFTRRLLSLVPAPYTPRTPNNEPEAAWRAPRKFFAKAARRLLRFPELDRYPTTAPTPPQPESAWRLVRAKFTRFTRRILVAPPPTSFPPTPLVTSQPQLGFLTRMLRSRRLQRSPVHNAYPQPSAPSFAPEAAVRLPKRHRRRGRLGLQLQPGPINEARVQPQWPSYAAAKVLKRRNTRRRLLAFVQPPATPLAPVVTSPEAAWRRPKSNVIQFRRKLQKLVQPPYAPRTPNNEPFSAWKQPKTNVVRFARRILKPREIDSYPTTAPTPPQPQAAWALKRPVRAAFRRSIKRVLRALVPAPYTPRTPNNEPENAWRLKRAAVTQFRRVLRKVPRLDRFTPTAPPPPPPETLRRRATAHRRIAVLHLPRYPQTPVVTEAFAAWKLKTPFRRHGWSERRAVQLLLEYPATTQKGYLTGTVQVRPAMVAAIAARAAMIADAQVSMALAGDVRLRPQEE